MDQGLLTAEDVSYATDSNGAVIIARPIEPARKPHPAWADYTVRGNGERIVDEHGQDLRYAAGDGWFEWDGQRWARDVEQQRALARANMTLTKMQIMGVGLKGGALKHVLASQSPSAWAAALKAAAVYQPIAANHDAFDDGPRAPPGHALRFNVASGTLNLADGDLRAHNRADMITRLSPATFDPESHGCLWRTFLATAQPDPLVQAFLQRLAGYWMCGTVQDEVFPIFWGLGGNGKGTFLDTIAAVMGDYAATVPEDVLTPPKGARPHPTGMMVFKGIRLAIASETEEGDTLAISTMKRLTGGDKIRARLMGKDFQEWKPTHKILMSTNAKPRLRGTVGPALMRRILFVGWDTVITRERADKTLKTRLLAPAELSGVLNWMLEGYREFCRIGLAPPATVTDSTAEYLANEDTLGSFVEDRLLLGDGREITADHLYKAYREYCRDSGELTAVRPQDFKPAFLAREDVRLAGVAWEKTRAARVYKNVDLRPRSKEDHEAADARRGWAPHHPN